MAEIFGYPIMGGGGSSGGTLTVTGVAGSTVTVSNADESYTRTLDSTGKAIFKGLASGTWTVTMTNGTQTATRSVEITADYSVSIAYFAATINVTYPAGSMCTATDGVTTLTAPNTTGTWECIVPNAGTWTINCTDGSLSTSGSISITAAGETKTLTLSYTRYLYVDGDKCENVTGGWEQTAAFGYTAAGQNSGTVTYNTDNFYCAPSDAAQCAMPNPVNAVDLTDVQTVVIDATVTGNSGGQLCYIMPTKTGIGNNSSVAQIGTSSAQIGVRTEYRLDVSALSGSYYLFVGALATRQARVYQIWLE